MPRFFSKKRPTSIFFAKAKFSAQEMVFMTKTFEHLAQRSGLLKLSPSSRKRHNISTSRLVPGQFVDKDAFLQWLPLPGILGERLFWIFDSENDGVITADEFLAGMAVCMKGSHTEKYRFLYEMYSLQGHDE
eukprot:Sdes_comp9498_c0_seq1m967